jgi:glycerol uptake facilitator-like aquaporin
MMDMTRRAAAEFFGTFWLVLGDCGAAVLAVAFPALGIGYIGTVEAMLNHPGYQTSLGSTQEARRGNG